MARFVLRHVTMFIFLFFCAFFFFMIAVNALDQRTFWFAFFESVVLGTAFYLLARVRFLVPLRDLSECVRAITNGVRSPVKGVSRQDEIGELARRLSEMSDDYFTRIDIVVREKEEIQAVFSGMAEAVLVIDHQEHIIHFSQSARRLLDMRDVDICGRHYWEVVRQDEINQLIRKCFTSPRPIDQDIVVHNPDEIFFHVQFSPISILNGRARSVVAVFHDISSLKKFDRMRAEFVANVSHELKTPLTSIKGFIETLKAGAVDDRPQAMRFLDIIDSQSRRLEALVSDILSLSAIESKSVSGDKGEMERSFLRPIIESLPVLYEQRIKNKQMIFLIDIPDDLPAVLMDRAQMEQVFFNLVDNALKFTPDGGRISVRCSLEAGFVRVDVRDNGIGIPSEHQVRIFERFYRVDKARSRELGGTGLGLAIVKHIVHWHNGKVAVNSQPGRGTEFSVFLPV